MCLPPYHPHTNFNHPRRIFKIYFAWINFREKPKNSQNREILSTQKLIHVRYLLILEACQVFHAEMKGKVSKEYNLRIWKVCQSQVKWR